MKALLAATAAAAVLALSACSGSGDDPGFGTSCTGLPSADPAVTLPVGIPRGVEDVTLTKTVKAGATTFYYGHTEGDDVVKLRDQILAEFENAGLTIESKDAEPPAEAEFQYSAEKDEGSVQVTPLCKGVLTVRWRVGPK